MVSLEITLKESSKKDNYYEFDYNGKLYLVETNKILLKIPDSDLISVINREIIKEDQISEIIFNWKWINEK
jgi:hypothetical protein